MARFNIKGVGLKAHIQVFQPPAEWTRKTPNTAKPSTEFQGSRADNTVPIAVVRIWVAVFRATLVHRFVLPIAVVKCAAAI